MPFRSEAQRRFLHATHPDIAERWEHEFPKKKKLPYHKKKSKKKHAKHGKKHHRRLKRTVKR